MSRTIQGPPLRRGLVFLSILILGVALGTLCAPEPSIARDVADITSDIEANVNSCQTVTRNEIAFSPDLRRTIRVYTMSASDALYTESVVDMHDISTVEIGPGASYRLVCKSPGCSTDTSYESINGETQTLSRPQSRSYTSIFLCDDPSELGAVLRLFRELVAAVQ
jgi:hypothetical protein